MMAMICRRRAGVRHAERIAAAVALILGWSLCAATVSAQSPAAAPTPKPGDATPAITTEHVVFVPYETMTGPEWGLEQSVLIPYAEFLKLMSTAEGQVDDPAFQPRAALAQAAYEGEIAGDVAVLDAVLTIDVLARKKDAIDVPLPFSGAAIERAEIFWAQGWRDGEQVSDAQPQLSARDSLGPLEGRPGLMVRLDGPGRREVRLRLVAPVIAEGAVKVLRFHVPAAGAASLRVRVAEDITLEPRQDALPARVQPVEGGGADILASAGAASAVVVAWRPRVERAEDAAQVRLSVRQHAEWTLGSQSAEGSISLNITALSGETDNVIVQLPAELRLLSVTGSFVKDWAAPDSAGRVAVQLVRAVPGEFQLMLLVQAAAEGERFAVPEVRVPEAVREAGTVIVKPEEGLAVWPEEASGLEAAAVAGGGAGARTFRFAQPGWTLTLSRRPIPVRLRAEGLALFEVTEEFVRLKARHLLTVSGRGVFDIALTAPAGFDLRDAGPPELVAGFRQEGRRVEITLRTEQRGTFTVETRLQRARPAGEGAVALEPLAVEGAEEEFGYIVLAAPLALRVTETEASGLDATDVRALQPQLQPMLSADLTPVLGYRYFEPRYRAVAAIERQRTRLTCETEMLALIQPSLLRVDVTFNFNVEFSATDTFQILLPASAGDDVRFFGADIKEKVRAAGQTDDGLTTWTLRLQRRMLGPVQISASFEQPLPEAPAGKAVELDVPRVRAAGVARESGHVAVSRGENLEVRVAKSDGLEPRDVKELPARLSSAFLGFRYFEPRGVALMVELIRHEPEKVLGALIRRLHIESVLTNQREVTHEVYMEVQNNSEQYLELKAPGTIAIWAAFVRGVPVRVTSRASDGAYLIELTKSEAMDKAFRVRLILKETLPGGTMGARGRVDFRVIESVNMPVQRTTWKLFLPRGYRYVDFGGDMRLEAGGKAPWIEPAAESLLNDLPAELAGGIARPALNPPQSVASAHYDAAETEEEKQARLRSTSALDFDIVKEGYQYTFSKLSGIGTIEVHYWKQKPLLLLQGALALVILVGLMALMWCGRMLIWGLAATVAAFIGASLTSGLAGRLLATAFLAAGAALALSALIYVLRQAKKSAKASASQKPPMPPPPPPTSAPPVTSAPMAPPDIEPPPQPEADHPKSNNEPPPPAEKE